MKRTYAIVLRFHIDGLRARRLPVPRPTTKLSALVRERGVEQIYTVLQVAA